MLSFFCFSTSLVGSYLSLLYTSCFPLPTRLPIGSPRTHYHLRTRGPQGRTPLFCSKHKRWTSAFRCSTLAFCTPIWISSGLRLRCHEGWSTTPLAWSWYGSEFSRCLFDLECSSPCCKSKYGWYPVPRSQHTSLFPGQRPLAWSLSNYTSPHGSGPPVLCYPLTSKTANLSIILGRVSQFYFEFQSVTSKEHLRFLW